MKQSDAVRNGFKGRLKHISFGAMDAAEFTRQIRNMIAVGLVLYVWGLLTGSPSPWIPIAVSAVLYLVTVYRGSLRQDLVKTYFPHWEKASRRIRGFDIWANPLVEFAHWIGVFSAAVGRCVNWRGIRYCVLPGGHVREIIRDDAEKPVEEPFYYQKAG